MQNSLALTDLKMADAYDEMGDGMSKIRLGEDIKLSGLLFLLVLFYVLPFDLPEFVIVSVVMICAMVFSRRFYFEGIQDVVKMLLACLWILLYVYLIKGNSFFADYRWIELILLLLIFCVLFSPCKNFRVPGKCDGKKIRVVYNSIYYIFFLFCICNSIKYIIPLIRGAEYTYGTYGHSMHSVDFAVVLLFAFMLGVKTKHYLSTLILAIPNILFIQARVYTFFILIFCLVLLFYKYYKKIRSWPAFNMYFKIYAIANVLFIGFIYFWVLILSHRYVLHDLKDGLFEVSNQMRFETDIYSIRVIIKNNLFFLPLDRMDLGEAWYANAANYDGLHYRGFTNPHSSLHLMALEFSVVGSLIFVYFLSKYFDMLSNKVNDAMIMAYILVSLILHQMLTGTRILLFLLILLIPENYFQIHNKIRIRIHIHKKL